jgi:LPPG:FO 2-phospho-L-lactate transferase
MEQHQSVVALAGGVGGAKLAQGLAGVVPGSQLTIIGNTADDFELWGLHISPDLDTVMYTLAGIANPVTGWGVVDDTHATLEAIGRYGVDTWFSLGDRDFATHILRTQRLREGQPLSTITADLASALGVSARLLPMTDQPVATMVRSGDELLDFQDYFVARRQQDTVDGVVFRGIEQATPGPGVLDAIAGADVIVFCPSNPIVSVGPILAVPGLRDAVRGSRAVKVGVSPIVGGKALKGPADRMLTSLGHESSALGVARIYRDLLDILVIDEVDRDLAPRVTNLGLQAAVAQTIMGDRQDRERLAAEVLAVAAAERVGA